MNNKNTLDLAKHVLLAMLIIFILSAVATITLPHNAQAKAVFNTVQNIFGPVVSSIITYYFAKKK